MITELCPDCRAQPEQEDEEREDYGYGGHGVRQPHLHRCPQGEHDWVHTQPCAMTAEYVCDECEFEGRGDEPYVYEDSNDQDDLAQRKVKTVLDAPAQEYVRSSARIVRGGQRKQARQGVSPVTGKAS